MPRISYFYGISIYMYPYDHPRPHFHADYAEYSVKVEFAPFRVVRGYAPRRVLAALEEWADLHQAELAANWALCEQGKDPISVSPLD